MKSIIATSPSQSQRLIACGVDPKTADMYWQAPITVSQLKSGEHLLMVKRKGQICLATDIPVWSISRLFELMPENIKGCWLTIQKLHTETYRYKYALGYLRCEYQDKKNPYDLKTYSDHKILSTGSNSLIEACVKAIEWLTKEGYKLNQIEE